MGRRETPVREGSPHIPLALWLRAQRRRAGMTYAELAEKTGHAPRTLKLAASGERLPKLQLVLDFATACGTDAAEATRHWQRAHARLTKTSGRTVLRPEYIATFAELRQAMIGMRARVGSPSLRKLEERAGPGRLPRSTISMVLRGAAPLREGTLVAFVEACGARPDEVEAWRNAWRRTAALSSAQARQARELYRTLSTLAPQRVAVFDAESLVPDDPGEETWIYLDPADLRGLSPAIDSLVSRHQQPRVVNPPPSRLRAPQQDRRGLLPEVRDLVLVDGNSRTSRGW